MVTGKLFLNTNLFIIKTFFITKFDWLPKYTKIVCQLGTRKIWIKIITQFILQKMFSRTLPFLSVCRLESALTYAFVQLLRHFFAQLPDLILELPLSFASWEIHEQPQFTHNFLVKSKAYCYFRINKTKIIFQFLWGILEGRANRILPSHPILKTYPWMKFEILLA